MTPSASIILGTVNAPYSANVSAHELAVGIGSIEAAGEVMGPVFSVFSEVDPDLQKAFVAELGLSDPSVKMVADHFQASCPFPLALAA